MRSRLWGHQNGTIPFSDGQIQRERRTGGALDDIHYHNCITQFDWGDTSYVVGVIVKFDAAAARQNASQIPQQYAITASPNPFNHATVLTFTIPRSAHATLSVSNILGRHVSVLGDGIFQAGEHQILFNGALLLSGIYFVRLQFGEHTCVRRLVLLK